MTRIVGPSDKSIFRDDPKSWKTYADPLPPCPLAPGDPVTVPSVSTIKDVDPKTGLHDWNAQQVALCAFEHRDALPTMTQDAAVDLLSRAANRHRDSAGERGHIIHEALEHLIDGKPLGIGLDAGHDADQYIDCLRQIVNDLRPVIVATEVVVFGDGYAGTFDAVWLVTQELIDALQRLVNVTIPPEWLGCNIIIDYKTRKITKAANRSPMEGAQLGAYSDGLYWIHEDGNGLHRMAPLPIVGGLLLSIAPDGYAPYVVDIEHARTHWSAVHTWWRAQRGATAMFSKGRTVKITDPTTCVTDPDWVDRLISRTAWMLTRIDAIKATDGALAVFAAGWPDGMPKPAAVRDGKAAWTGADIDELVRRANDTEARFEIPFGPLDPTAPKAEQRTIGVSTGASTPAPAPATNTPRQFTAPTVDNDLAPTDPDTVNALRAELAALPAEQVATVLAWSQAASRHGVSWAMPHTGPCPTDTYMRAAAAVVLVQTVDGEFLNLVEFDTHDTTVGTYLDALAISPGVAIGLLTAEQCDDLINRLRTAGSPAATAA